jgi:hypothetical protein
MPPKQDSYTRREAGTPAIEGMVCLPSRARRLVEPLASWAKGLAPAKAEPMMEVIEGNGGISSSAMAAS